MEPAKQSQKPAEYIKIADLGEGSYGKAFKVQDKLTKEYGVIKQIDIEKLSSKEQDAVIKEGKILE